MPTMKEAIVDPDTNVKIADSPVPEPASGQVLIKVVVSGTNPKDWKVPFWMGNAANSGDDIAGTVAAVGPDVAPSIRVGDRVAAFHIMMTPHGSFAEYAIAPHHTVFHIPDRVSFEEAATVPLAAYTAAVAIFHRLEFPSPWDAEAAKSGADKPPRALVVYGASTAVGAFGIKLARQANIHPIVAVGSANSAFVEPLLDAAKGDALVDYRQAKSEAELTALVKDAVAKALRAAGAQGGDDKDDLRAFDVYDCVSEPKTFGPLSQAIAGPPDAAGRKPRLATVLPFNDYSAASKDVDVVTTNVAHVTEDSEAQKLFGLIWGQSFARGLAQGWLTAHPYEVLEGGLEGLQGGLRGLRDGTVRAKKVLVRIGDTPGV